MNTWCQHVKAKQLSQDCILCLRDEVERLDAKVKRFHQQSKNSKRLATLLADELLKLKGGE